MANSEKVVSPGVFTNEIDQSFLPAAIAEIGAAIVGPTAKGPVLTPTLVNNYSDYQAKFGDSFLSGSDYQQYLTSHTAREYLKHGSKLTVVRVADYDAARATATISKTNTPSSSIVASPFFTLEVLGDGPEFNNFCGTGSSFGTDNILPPRAHAAAGNNHFGTGSFGGTVNNFRWEVTSRNLKKGTFSLVIRQGNDTIKRKQILETHSNLSFDPKSPDYILKRIGNEKNTITVEAGQAFIQPVGEYPNKSAYVRVSDLPDANKTPDYLDENGDINTEYSSSATNYFPTVGSGSYGGAFGESKDISAGSPMTLSKFKQTPGAFGSEIAHPFLFYDNIYSQQ